MSYKPMATPSRSDREGTQHIGSGVNLRVRGSVQTISGSWKREQEDSMRSWSSNSRDDYPVTYPSEHREDFEFS